TTDPRGFVNAFTEAGHAFDGKAVAVPGNGGAARAIAFTLALMTPARKIALVARDRGKSGTLITGTKASAAACDIVSLDWPEYPDVRRDFGVIVNTPPIGMHPNVEESPLAAELLEPGQIIYDIVYNPEE